MSLDFTFLKLVLLNFFFFFHTLAQIVIEMFFFLFSFFVSNSISVLTPLGLFTYLKQCNVRY